MRRAIIAGAVAAMAIGAAPAQAAPTIYFINGSYAYPYSTTATVFESFQAAKDVSGQQFVAGANEAVSGNVTVQSGSIANTAIDPDPANTGGTQYLAVGAGGSFTYNFTAPVQFFSFLLGTLDTYNSLSLTFTGGGSQTYTGAQIIGLASPTDGFNGAANSTTSGRVTFDAAGGAGITSATFQSQFAAFEIDALASAVPEPATWGLMILGVGFAGASMRTRRRKVAFAAA